VIVMIVATFWNIALCSPYVNLATCCTLLYRSADDGGDTFLRNVSSRTNHTALYPRRLQHSNMLLYSSLNGNG
jgi:hypothetical protein